MSRGQRSVRRFGISEGTGPVVDVITAPPTGAVHPVKVKLTQRFQTTRYFISVYSISFVFNYFKWI